MSFRGYLVGKGPSLDNVRPEWLGTDEPVWALNQAATIVRDMLPGREIHCVQNDGWIGYAPPEDVLWHCAGGVPTGSHSRVERYSPEMLTGKWGSPSCVCALELMRCNGLDEVVMVGFDSHFSGVRSYAASLGVAADEIAPYHYYDTIMRRRAHARHVRLLWMDADGELHEDAGAFSHCLVAVALGEKYERQTDGMIASFLAHNPGWSVERYYGARLEALLPDACRHWTPFDKCEIGRWVAMQRCLEDYDSVVYADGDVRWYAPYESSHAPTIVLTPHYVTGAAKNNAKHWIMKDGAANIGIIEVNRSVECDGLFDFVVGETLHDPQRHRHGAQLWLQNLVSTIPDCGYDCIYRSHPGYNVAAWNLRKGDREMYEQGGRLMVRTNTGVRAPLVSFHFSAKSLASLANYGPTVKRLLEEYLHNG